MTDDEVQAKLNYWIATVTGVADVVNANSDRKRPGLPYLSSNLTLSGPLYDSASDTVFTDTLQIPVRDWYWRFSVFAYGKNSGVLLRKIEAAFPILTYHAKLLPLVLAETSPVRNVPELVENKIESRANMDIEVRGVNREGLPVDLIEKSPFSVEKVANG